MKIVLLITTYSLLSAKIIVAAATNTIFVMEHIKNEFQKEHPNIHIDFSFASSGQLTNQIINKAPFDIFLSANMQYPQKLYEMNLSLSKPKTYAKGLLIIFSTTPKNFDKNLSFLQKDNIKIAIANSVYAPYGKATIQVLKKLNLLTKIKHKLVIAPNISSVANLTIHAAQIGFISKSALYSKELSKYNVINKYYKPINNKWYSKINQGAILLKNSTKLEESQKFYDFIFSKKAKIIFEKYGYNK